MKATNKQIGGSHYKDMPIQPVEFIHRNGIPFIEGSVIKYVSRWRKKGGVEDLKKAKHFLDLLIEMGEPKETLGPLWGGEDYTSPELPWPEKYEVGMKFRRQDGEIAQCVVDGGIVARITGSDGWRCEMSGNNVWGYVHGAKVIGSDRHPATLVEYLGKD